MEYDCAKCSYCNNVGDCCEQGEVLIPIKGQNGFINAEKILLSEIEYESKNNANLIQPVYLTVDIAMTDRANVLLGRKHGETGWRFIGGFVDKTDSSILDAAKRELYEEVSSKRKGVKLMTDNWDIISTPVNLNTLHHNINEPIFNVFYSCKYISGVLEANDDIEEIKWHPFNDINKIEFVDAHKNLKRLFYNHIKI